MSQLIGQTIGPYQVVLHIRTTSISTIYKAFDTRLGRSVALQVLLLDLELPASLPARMKEHAAGLAQLSHPNIGALRECDIYEDLLCLAYDFVPRGILRRRFNRNMTWDQAARTMIPVAQALAHAHRNNIMHGRLRPSSILIRDDGTPALFDFGVEQLAAQEVLAQAPGTWLGSEVSSYMAPEQVLGQPVDQRSDIYSFGMVLYELLNGRRAYQGDSTFAEIVKQYSDPQGQQRKQKKEKSLPETAILVLEKALARDPARRFQDMQHLTGLLARIVLNQPVPPKMINNPDWRPPRPLPLAVWALAGLLFLVMLAFGGYRFVITNPQAVAQVGIVLPTQPIPTDTPTATAPPATATPTLAPSATQAPQTATPTTPPQLTPTRAASAYQRYPFLANTPVPLASEAITISNALRLQTLSRLGIGRLNDFAWRPDGKSAALATSTGVYLLDGDLASIQRYIDTASIVSSAAFSPDGSLLATGDTNGLVRLWDAGSGAEVASLGGHSGRVRRLVFSGDGKLLASVSEDTTARLWDVPGRTLLRTLNGHVQAVSGAAFSPDGSTLATVSLDQVVLLWPVSAEAQPVRITYSAALYDAAFSPDGQVLYAGDSRGNILRWNPATGSMDTPLYRINTPVSELKLSPDGQWLAVGDANGLVRVVDMQGALRLSVENKNLPRVGGGAAGGPDEYSHRLAFTPDSTSLTSAIWDDTIRTWDLATGAERKQDWLAEFIQELEVSPDGKYLAAQTLGSTVQLWDLPNAKLLRSFDGALTDGQNFSNNSQQIALRSSAASLSIYSVVDGEKIFTFYGHSDVRGLSFSKDNTLFASGNATDLHVWSLSSGQELEVKPTFGYNGCKVANTLGEQPLAFATLYSYVDLVSTANTSLCSGVARIPGMLALRYQREGTTAVAGGQSNLEVWNYRQGKPEKIRMNNTTGLTFEAVAISKNGSWIAAASNSTTKSAYVIYIYDVASRSSITTLEGHGAPIKSLELTPDEKYLISASSDGTIRIWGVQ